MDTKKYEAFEKTVELQSLTKAAQELGLTQSGVSHMLSAIEAELQLPQEEVVMALESIVSPISLYDPVYSDGGDTIYVLDQVGDNNDDRNWLDEIALKESIKHLNEREKHILSLRFMQGKTQSVFKIILFGKNTKDFRKYSKSIKRLHSI